MPFVAALAKPVQSQAGAWADVIEVNADTGISNQADAAGVIDAFVAEAAGYGRSLWGLVFGLAPEAGVPPLLRSCHPIYRLHYICTIDYRYIGISISSLKRGEKCQRPAPARCAGLGASLGLRAGPARAVAASPSLGSLGSAESLALHSADSASQHFHFALVDGALGGLRCGSWPGAGGSPGAAIGTLAPHRQGASPGHPAPGQANGLRENSRDHLLFWSFN